MRSFACALACLVLAAPAARAAEPELMAALSVMGYGYKVKVTVNGADIGVEGGKSEGRRLFNKDNEMAQQAPPAVRAKNFVLLQGTNDFAIEYTKVDLKSPDSLEITLEAAGYPQPLLRIVSKAKLADKLALRVHIADKPPADFKPINIRQ